MIVDTRSLDALIDNARSHPGNGWGDDCSWLEKMKWEFGNDEPDEVCSMEHFFKEQMMRHPNTRAAGALLVCRCSKCTRSRGTL